MILGFDGHLIHPTCIISNIDLLRIFENKKSKQEQVQRRLVSCRASIIDHMLRDKKFHFFYPLIIKFVSSLCYIHMCMVACLQTHPNVHMQRLE